MKYLNQTMSNVFGRRFYNKLYNFAILALFDRFDLFARNRA